MTKKCFKCSKEKDLGEFYKHKEMNDGHLGKCKECAKLDATNHRNNNIDKIRAYDRDRASLSHRKKLASVIRKRYRKRYPLRSAANSMVSRAVRDGRITKPNKCEACADSSRIYGHHRDYYKPLEVMWLCQPCHKQQHKQEKQNA